MGYSPYRRKLTLVGDFTVGKTCLATTYITGTYPPGGIPSRYDNNWVEDFDFEHKSYEVEIWDVPCREDFVRLRPLHYPDTDVFMLCFSLDDLSTYENIRTLWYPETAGYSPDSDYLLVGTKLDLKEAGDLAEEGVRYEQGEALAKEIGAAKYMECSAFTGQNLRAVFEEAFRLAVKRPPRKPSRFWKGCIIT